MRLLVWLALVAAGFFLIPLPLPVSSASHGQLRLLSPLDQRTGGDASLLAARSPLAAVRWLRRQKRVVSSVQLGPDRATIDIHFRDETQVSILPRISAFIPLKASRAASGRIHKAANRDPSARAVVLEPFANELGLGADAG